MVFAFLVRSQKELESSCYFSEHKSLYLKNIIKKDITYALLKTALVQIQIIFFIQTKNLNSAL